LAATGGLVDQRLDPHTEHTIETAIQTATSEGYALPARYLAESGIPLRVIMRVLTQPDNRRGMSVEPRAS
jgi:hypothetical protein